MDARTSIPRSNIGASDVEVAGLNGSLFIQNRLDELDFEDFFENGSLPLHPVGADGIILHANRAELELLGYEPDESAATSPISMSKETPPTTFSRA